MESEGEIEYLDEDAEIVQQLVQVPVAEQTFPLPEKNRDIDSEDDKLLVELKQSDNKKKKKTESEDDSDYDPRDEFIQASNTAKRKRRAMMKHVVAPITKTSQDPKVKTSQDPKVKTYTKLKQSSNRKKMDIRIPDYEDPLCLPVTAVRSIGSDVNRLRNWNNACLEHFKQCDTLLKPENGETKSSSRTIILKNVVHKETGRKEITVWSKTCVTNQEGVKKSENFQCLLPKYREKKTLPLFKLNAFKKKNIHYVDEVVLTKEEHKNGEVLVVYKPQEKLSAVYKFDTEEKIPGLDIPDDSENPRRAMREITSCRVCASCYQASWRGSSNKSEKKKFQCPICSRMAISMYNLLTHLRAHTAQDVRRHRKQITDILAEVVDYHYKCRICTTKFQSIKALRQHVPAHRGTDCFKCEIGNHMAY